MRQRVTESYAFGPGANSFSTYSVGVNGSLSYLSPKWISTSDRLINGTVVSPFIDGTGNVVYTRPLILRLQTRFDVSTPSQDSFFIVPTSGITPPLPSFCYVFAIALYAVAADQNSVAGVVVF